MGMQMAHPMHVHNVHFRVLQRVPAALESAAMTLIRSGFVDEGLKDTVQVLPGETVRVLMEFGEHAGLYLYHCHILEHEDLGMMRNFMIRAALSDLHTMRVNGSSSSARISLGISGDQWLTTSTRINAPTDIELHGAIVPEPEHMGLPASVLVVINTGSGDLLALNALGQLAPLDEANPAIYAVIPALRSRHEFQLLKTRMGLPLRGQYQIFIGYSVDAPVRFGRIIYNAVPLQLNVL